jgi:hypothetical protein
MRREVLSALGLSGLENRVVGAALLARTAARQSFRVEGASPRTTSLALLSIGALALVDGTSARQVAAGLAEALQGQPTPLIPLLAGLAQGTAGREEPRPLDWSLDAIEDARARREGAVFALVTLHAAELGLPVQAYWGESPSYLHGEAERQRSLPTGRLGIPVSRWLALATDEPRRARVAALDVLRRGADEMRLAMSDVHHWRMLHAGLAPVEPELLLAALVLHASARDDGFGSEVEDELDDDEVIRATVVVAGDLLPETWQWLHSRELSDHWGGMHAPPPDRFARWRQSVQAAPPEPIPW